MGIYAVPDSPEPASSRLLPPQRQRAAGGGGGGGGIFCVPDDNSSSNVDEDIEMVDDPESGMTTTTTTTIQPPPPHGRIPVADGALARARAYPAATAAPVPTTGAGDPPVHGTFERVMDWFSNLFARLAQREMEPAAAVTAAAPASGRPMLPATSAAASAPAAAATLPPKPMPALLAFDPIFSRHMWFPPGTGAGSNPHTNRKRIRFAEEDGADPSPRPVKMRRRSVEVRKQLGLRYGVLRNAPHPADTEQQQQQDRDMAWWDWLNRRVLPPAARPFPAPGCPAAPAPESSVSAPAEHPAHSLGTTTRRSTLRDPPRRGRDIRAWLTDAVDSGMCPNASHGSRRWPCASRHTCELAAAAAAAAPVLATKEDGGGAETALTPPPTPTKKARRGADKTPPVQTAALVTPRPAPRKKSPRPPTPHPRRSSRIKELQRAP